MEINENYIDQDHTYMTANLYLEMLYKLWFWDNCMTQDVAQEFGIQVMPTFVLLKEGKEVKRLIGAKMDELESLISMYSPAAVSY